MCKWIIRENLMKIKWIIRGVKIRKIIEYEKYGKKIECNKIRISK